MADSYSKSTSQGLTPILAGAALVLAGYLVLDRAGFLDAEPRGEPRIVKPRGELADFEKAAIDIFQESRPSVVHITLARRVGGGRLGTGAGSGFLWDDQGHIITNFHVVRDYEPTRWIIRVRTYDSREYLADLVQADPSRDIAVLRFKTPPSNLRPVQLGTSGDLQVGQSVFAIGNPFGLDHTFTTGVVSALNRSIMTGGGLPLDGLIQTDAAINPGSSGGPLLDSAGRLVGMNAAIVSETGNNSGVSFAVPVDVINQVVPQLIENRLPPRALLGIQRMNPFIPYPLPEQTKFSYAIPIAIVDPEFGAHEAGIAATRFDRRGYPAGGDMLVAIDDQPVEHWNELSRIMKDYVPGDVVKATLVRITSDTEFSIVSVEVTLQAEKTP